MTLVDPYLPTVAELAALFFFEVLRPNMRFIFDDLLCRPLYRSRFQSGTLILPSGDFPGEGGVILFRDIHDKYLIKIPKRYVIPLRIERRTRW